MKNKVALIIIFNHKYDKNIPVLESIYRDRFTNIFYLVPFYTGNRSDVIPVYENSFYFQGYISQALKHFYSNDFEHYLFIGDDLMLNPIINETNYKKHLKLESGTSFLPGFVSLHETHHWPRIRDAYGYDLKKAGVEAASELPSYQEALNMFKKMNLHFRPMSYTEIYKNESVGPIKQKIKHFFKWWYRRLKHLLKNSKFTLPYPVIGSYADVIVISSQVIKKFSHYCGIFAATDLHVELAIPTALVFSTSNIVTEKDIRLQGKPLWSVDELKELDKYELNLDKLLNNFPDNNLYLHPIKLSKWR